MDARRASIDKLLWFLREREYLRADVAYHQRSVRLLRRFSRLGESVSLSGPEADLILYAVARSADVDLSGLPLPYVGVDDVIEEVSGWTAGRVRKCIATIAAVNPDDPAELLAITTAHEERQHRRVWHELKTVERDLDRMRRERMLTESSLFEKIHRQETNLSRELSIALRELKDLQTRGAGLSPRINGWVGASWTRTISYRENPPFLAGAATEPEHDWPSQSPNLEGHSPNLADWDSARLDPGCGSSRV